MSTFPIQIILSISKNSSMLYLIQMKLLQEFLDRFSSVNGNKIYKQLVNYTSCSMVLYGFNDPQTTVDVDCACVAEIVYLVVIYYIYNN